MDKGRLLYKQSRITFFFFFFKALLWEREQVGFREPIEALFLNLGGAF